MFKAEYKEGLTSCPKQVTDIVRINKQEIIRFIQHKLIASIQRQGSGFLFVHNDLLIQRIKLVTFSEMFG